MGDGAEVVDDGQALDADSLAEPRRLDHPRIVGQL
jgi:hypothetical protein